jgi:hypothetical protein
VVGENFNPEVGYVRRDDMRKSFGKFTLSPRPRSITGVRQFFFEGSIDYITNLAGQLETREGQFNFQTRFDNGDAIVVAYGTLTSSWTRSSRSLKTRSSSLSAVTASANGCTTTGWDLNEECGVC